MKRLLLTALCALLCGALCADELITKDGTRLVGKFEKLEAGHYHFNDTSAGAVKVPADKVASFTLEKEAKVKVRRGDDAQLQEDATIFTKDGLLYVRGAKGDDELAPFDKLRGINETVPDLRPVWSASLIGIFGWTEGNTKTYSLGFRGDLKREGRANSQGLYVEGRYLQDRNIEEEQVRQREYAAGYYYRYIFPFRLTIDLTEDVTFNELAGYHWRSITGLGPGYFLLREENTSLHFGAHVTYTYEDLMNGADNRSYWGARARAEFDWVSADKRFHVNARSEMLFDFDESKNLVVNNALLAEARLTAWANAGVLVRHSWDNMPVPGFFRHDFSLTFTVGVSWSGRWV
ncbi:MAG: DUF481 domain-containing protein [Planctomycetes bacterium]|jgi:hypothetical protein|nr:DUF481 domain-containing protein [Planctomycetota bacterium]MCL4730211.1 DUF481 domain-containing protein [Planctomycetota bacterium]